MHPNMRNFTAPYVFVEYPKWVTLADGSQIIVENADEEAAATGGDDERETLMAQARELGLSPHPRTGVEKLKTLINDAKECQS